MAKNNLYHSAKAYYFRNSQKGGNQGAQRVLASETESPPTLLVTFHVVSLLIKLVRYVSVLCFDQVDQ